jgi:BCD family chlorophyll transporter-like MFS transporter
MAFVALGAGVSAAGTPLLALLAELVPAAQRARAAAVVWLMMIAGFIVTTLVASRLLEPFSMVALVRAVAFVVAVALAVALVALRGLEAVPGAVAAGTAAGAVPFRVAVAHVWADRPARLFACFVFVSMLAYSAQDLILEPFAGAIFGLTPAESTRVSSMHHGGMLVGMIACALLAMRLGGLRPWAAAGCALSALALVSIALAPSGGGVAQFRASVVALGLANGVFAIGAIGSMMALSVAAGGGTTGVRMGVFGAAQATAYAIGGSLGAVLSDVARALMGGAREGYTSVFVLEAVLFLVAAAMALRAIPDRAAAGTVSPQASGDALLAQLG